jgi:hypothetical protein
MHDLDRQQLEQHERRGLASPSQLGRPTPYPTANAGYQAPPPGHGGRPRSGRWIRHGRNIVLLGA